jgi:hypothetical protein
MYSFSLSRPFRLWIENYVQSRNEAQRSGFVSERTNDGAGELSALAGSELSEVREDVRTKGLRFAG